MLLHDVINVVRIVGKHFISPHNLVPIVDHHHRDVGKVDSVLCGNRVEEESAILKRFFVVRNNYRQFWHLIKILSHSLFG